MVLGLSLAAFTAVHTILSLIALVIGIGVVAAMAAGKEPGGWTHLFLALTTTISITGFLFPFGGKVLPSHITGAISLAVLAVAYLAYYRFHMAGRWRATYIVTAVIAFYLNAFVAVVQAFLNIAPLRALAPTQSEPPFQAAQGALLLVVGVVGYFAVKKYHPAAAA